MHIAYCILHIAYCILHININEYKQNIINTKDNTELRLMWDDSIDYRVINNDYLGPTTEHVVDMYNRLMVFEK